MNWVLDSNFSTRIFKGASWLGRSSLFIFWIGYSVVKSISIGRCHPLALYIKYPANSSPYLANQRERWREEKSFAQNCVILYGITPGCNPTPRPTLSYTLQQRPVMSGRPLRRKGPGPRDGRARQPGPLTAQISSYDLAPSDARSIGPRALWGRLSVLNQEGAPPFRDSANPNGCVSLELRDSTAIALRHGRSQKLLPSFCAALLPSELPSQSVLAR